jgi:hypothetical protein
MKTTVELNDSLLSKTKETARRRGTTMKEIIESALRRYFEEESAADEPYRFENHPFEGRGVREGIDEGSWETLRSRIYEGRGG